MKKLLMNTWYMGAWAHEVSSSPLSRRLLGEKTMFFRKLDGTGGGLARSMCAPLRAAFEGQDHR